MSSPSFQTQEKFLFVLRVSTRKLRMAFSYIDSLVQNVQRKGKENVTICLLFLAFFFQQSIPIAKSRLSRTIHVCTQAFGPTRWGSNAEERSHRHQRTALNTFVSQHRPIITY